MPRPRPDILARTEEPAPAGKASSSEIDRRTSVDPTPSTHQAQPARKSRERQEMRQSATRKETAKSGREAISEEVLRSEPEESTPAARSRGEQEERATRSRPGRDELTRTTRSRTGQEESRESIRTMRSRAAPVDDDDGYTLVRSYRARDGRRQTVYERPIEEERPAAREERPSAPFSFNPAAPGD